ncbi:MAG: hypothetical protein JWM98_1852, partial [Thermoleophilia bacterium]|nr:hypothetical protein [Thermoleophilia bacterium]
MQSWVMAADPSDQRPDARIATIAGMQYGIVTLWQLLDCGLTSSSVRRRVAAGRLHRIHPRTFAVGHTDLSFEARVIAATLAVGAGAAAAGLCAATIWRVSRFGVPEVEVLAPRRHRGLDRVVVRSSRSFPRGDRTIRRRIPITTMTRTIVDLADVLTAPARIRASRGSISRIARRPRCRTSHLDPSQPPFESHAGACVRAAQGGECRDSQPAGGPVPAPPVRGRAPRARREHRRAGPRWCGSRRLL